MGAAYLGFLLVAISGLLACDQRWHLVFFYDARRAAKVIALGVGLFLLWDLAGAGLGIFFPANSHFTLGIHILPGIHIEEIPFLFLLCYAALVVWRGSERLWPHTSS